MNEGTQVQHQDKRPSRGWVAFGEGRGMGNSQEGAASNPFRGNDVAALGNPFANEGLSAGSVPFPNQPSVNQGHTGNPFFDDESALSSKKPPDNTAPVARAAAAAGTGASPSPVWRAAQSSAALLARGPAPTLPPTVAAAAAAAAALGGGGAPTANVGQLQGPHQNLDQLLKELPQGGDGTERVWSEEAAELARIQRIRESWRGLVAPKAQRCSREGLEASSPNGHNGTPAAQRERAIPANPKPRTSLELRMAAAEALHVARRASPKPESLFGVEEHLVQERPPSAPMAHMPHFPSPGPWDSSHGRQQHSASVPTHSPQLSFLGDAEQLPQDRRLNAHDMMWQQQQTQGGGLAAILQGFPIGATTEHGAGGEGLCAYDAAGSALELRMAAAEALAVTQRAAWEQQQQQQQEQQQRVVFLASETSGSQAPLHTQPKQQQHQQQQEELDEQRGRPGDHLSAEQLRLEQQGRAAGMVEEWPGKNPSKPHVRLKARRVRRA
mmetsp:Transcript_28551/g.73570  ORF Transcript_28551/g.73570 Transcript_28551/m.73570 type:complete len:497 (+) Transcript_28551:88-1578(+)